MQFQFFHDLECPKPGQHSQFYDGVCYLWKFWFGNTVKSGKDGELWTEFINEKGITTVFIEEPLALPMSGNDNQEEEEEEEEEE